MGHVLRDVARYHKRIGLRVGVYHVDPFWFSHTPNGGCEAGPVASNWSASSFHFPSGLRSLGLRLMPFLQSFSANNIYRTQYKFDGQSVLASQSANLMVMVSMNCFHLSETLFLNWRPL